MDKSVKNNLVKKIVIRVIQALQGLYKNSKKCLTKDLFCDKMFALKQRDKFRKKT